MFWGKWLGFILVSMVASGSWASTSESLMQNLRSRIHPLSSKRGSLIKSFADHSQSYVYDQALAIIAFSKNQDQKNAEALLQGLASLQLEDGSLYFSYYLDGKSPYPIEGDKRFAGALAWVALSVSHYESSFNSEKFHPFQHKLLSYLHSQTRSVSLNGKKVEALAFNASDIKESAWSEKDTAALEHNLDFYAALVEYHKLHPASPWKGTEKEIKKFITSLWDKSRSHFWSGINLKTGTINKEEIYLDNQTWSMLALDSDTLKKLDLASALALNCEALYVEDKNVFGFMDRSAVRSPASQKFVWSEGSLGQVMAMKKFQQVYGKDLTCQGKSQQELLSSIYQMKQKDGGIAYATATNADFTTSSSVAGTAWLYFASLNFNPFIL